MPGALPPPLRYAQSDAKCWAHTQLDLEGGVPPATMKLYRDLMIKLDERGRSAMPGRAQG